MGVPTGRRWIALSLLAVVLPVSLLATLRLTGILPEPPTPEIKTAEAAGWHMYRPKLDPYHSLYLNQTIQNGYSNKEISTTMSIYIIHYFEDWSESPFEYRDGVSFQLNVTSDSLQGYIESILLKYYVLDLNASVAIGTREAVKEYDVEVTKMHCYGTYPSAAYVEAQALGPSCGLFTQVWWIFDDENSEDHTLKATSEILYYNGTTYQKIVVPIVLEMKMSRQNG